MQAVCRICRSADRSATPLVTASRLHRQQCHAATSTASTTTPTTDTTTSKSNDTSMDELLAPCKCRGTMRWVHRGCLEEWRHASAPGSDSFLRCDMCKTAYRFKASWWRRVLGGEVAVLAYTAAICAVLVAMAVMVAAECRRSLEEVMPFLGQDLLYHHDHHQYTNGNSQPVEYFLQFTRSSIDTEMAKNLFAGLAALSLIQLLIVDGSVGLSFNLMFSLWRLIHYDFKLDYVISTVFVMIGLMRMVVEVRRVIRVVSARLLTFQIIDYHDDLKCE